MRTLLLLSVSLAASAQPALTIYNQNFAVVRDTVPLDLQSGVNSIRYAGATAQVKTATKIIEANEASVPFFGMIMGFV